MLNELIVEFLEHLEVEKNLSPLTIKNYHHYLLRFSNWLSKASPTLLSDVTKIDQNIIKKYRLYLSRLVDDQNEPLSKITQNYHIIALRAFFRYLIKKDIAVLPPEKIDLAKIESRSVKFLTREQIETLLAQPDTSNIIGLRDKAILETLFSTGLRVSELSKLNREKINLKTREFGVIGKGGRARVVFLSDSACRWLEAYLNARKDNFKPLFIRYSRGLDATKNGENMRLTTRSIERIVEKYVKKAGLPIDATCHTLRHSFATDLLQAGADLRSVQELLGHKNIATTQVYTHITNPQLKEIHRRFHRSFKTEDNENK